VFHVRRQKGYLNTKATTQPGHGGTAATGSGSGTHPTPSCVTGPTTPAGKVAGAVTSPLRRQWSSWGRGRRRDRLGRTGQPQSQQKTCALIVCRSQRAQSSQEAKRAKEDQQCQQGPTEECGPEFCDLPQRDSQRLHRGHHGVQAQSQKGEEGKEAGSRQERQRQQVRLFQWQTRRRGQ